MSLRSRRTPCCGASSASGPSATSIAATTQTSAHARLGAGSLTRRSTSTRWNCRRPLEALHTLEPHPSVVATLYPGDSSRGPGSRRIHTATLEPRLRQLGQGQPVVNVAFRQYEEGEQRYEDGFLRLTLADARELVTALNYLIEMADRG